MSRIRGVLLDSGDTMIRPIGGRWNPRFDFEDVLAHHAPHAPRERFAEAFADGDAFLHAAPSTASRDDYHRAILDALGVDPTGDLLRALDAPLDVPVVEPFPEVPAALDALRERGVRLAVVSDAWPGLPAMYERLGLRGHFDAFVVSAVLRTRKPDPRMYRAASDALSLAAADCLFVDDDAGLVQAAIALGYRGATIDRDGPGGDGTVRDLLDVVRLVDRS